MSEAIANQSFTRAVIRFYDDSALAAASVHVPRPIAADGFSFQFSSFQRTKFSCRLGGSFFGSVTAAWLSGKGFVLPIRRFPLRSFVSFVV
jgi:hypothetical protein